MLKKHEVHNALTFVDEALNKRPEFKENDFDFLHQGEGTQGHYLLFESSHVDLLIEFLDLLMKSYGIEQNFVEEERFRVSIEKIKEGMKKKLH